MWILFFVFFFIVKLNLVSWGSECGWSDFGWSELILSECGIGKNDKYGENFS